MINLKKIYHNEMFHPKIIGIFINPFYIARRGIYKAIFNNRKYITGRLLDVGCGSKPYESIFEVEEYIGIDIEQSGHNHDNSRVDVYYDGKTIPFENNSFDTIFSSEVFEHVFNLEELCNEIYRVLKPGGNLVITLPFVWDEHEIPYDFARYTCFGIKHILNKAGFEVVVSEKTTNYVETIYQMWIAYIFQHIFPKNKILKLILTPFFIAPMTIKGKIFNFILPKNKNFYHNNFIVATKN